MPVGADTPERKRCVCAEGYTGESCEVEIGDYLIIFDFKSFQELLNYSLIFITSPILDECESDPCLYGGLCINEVNGYSCECANPRFSGPRCEVRPSDLCNGENCGGNGACFEVS